MPPLVSVVITTYNTKQDWLQEAIESALKQTYRDLEVIVVDDGSTLDMTWVTERHGTRLRYVRKENGGPASARNLGIRFARGRYVAFLDGDDVWVSDKLEAQMALFASAPETALVYARAGTVNDAGQTIARRSERLPKYAGRVLPQLFMRCFIGTSTVVVQRECVVRVGLFDEARDLISVEDYDLWLRIAERYPVDYVDRVLVTYRLHEEGISQNSARSYTGEHRVISRAIARNLPSHPELLPMLKRRFAQLFFEWGYEYFEAERLQDARTQFGASLRYRPQNMRVWAYWGSTWLGPGGVERMRRWKRRLDPQAERRPAGAARG